MYGIPDIKCLFYSVRGNYIGDYGAIAISEALKETANLQGL